ncbi:serine carboxypeptidase 1-like [Aristolochia californica]|uniref:serine carboxypeptidase 1-like n=1 Tax=Aristolochia californica TaxID=171875 RepID=UPI0035DC7E1F
MRLAWFLLVFVIYAEAYRQQNIDPLDEFLKAKSSKREKYEASSMVEFATLDMYSPVYIGSQDGFMEDDKIDQLPGQPEGVDFDQYAGYVTVDPSHGRTLFYYFVESPENAAKPLVLWLNGGPGCSSLGAGAMMELGPFRVNSDGKTLSRNKYGWNNVANILFLESPAGVGFSYSNATSDYDLSGDKRTADDSYTFLLNWLERFPQYKSKDFFITGESYAGHYVPQLAQLILQRNKITNQTVINLRGIAIGNAWIDSDTGLKGMYEFFATHALISDETRDGIIANCKFSNISLTCQEYLQQAHVSIQNIYIYHIYAPFCSSFSGGHVSNQKHAAFDPCSDDYIYSYLNLPEVQKALHANLTNLPGPWSSCNFIINLAWTDSPDSVLETINELMASEINVWIYSGDVDGRVTVTSTRMAINRLRPSVETSWYPWFADGEVGGYAVGYQNLTFVTIREAGHFVPSYQPARALKFFTYFIGGQLPPRASS